jgi:hypothetical protein
MRPARFFVFRTFANEPPMSPTPIMVTLLKRMDMMCFVCVHIRLRRLKPASTLIPQSEMQNPKFL